MSKDEKGPTEGFSSGARLCPRSRSRTHGGEVLSSSENTCGHSTRMSDRGTIYGRSSAACRRFHTQMTRISMAVRKTTATKKETKAARATSEVSTEKPTATQSEVQSVAPATDAPVKPERVRKKLGEPRGPHGGARPGAGRPPIDGKRFAATYRIRISAELHARCIAEGSTAMRALLTNYFALKDSVPDADPRAAFAKYAEEKTHEIPTDLPAANLRLPKRWH